MPSYEEILNKYGAVNLTIASYWSESKILSLKGRIKGRQIIVSYKIDDCGDIINDLGTSIKRLGKPLDVMIEGVTVYKSTEN